MRASCRAVPGRDLCGGFVAGLSGFALRAGISLYGRLVDAGFGKLVLVLLLVSGAALLVQFMRGAD